MTTRKGIRFSRGGPRYAEGHKTEQKKWYHIFFIKVYKNYGREYRRGQGREEREVRG